MTPDEMPAHFRLSPSSSHRWLRCPGSALPPGRLPDYPNEAAEIGTWGHDIAQRILHGDLEAIELCHDPKLVERWESFDPPLIRSCIEQYVEYVTELEGDKFFECKIASPYIRDFGGTVDTICVTRESLHIADFKTGWQHVPAMGNTQIKCYMILARQKYPGRSEFSAAIVQPKIRSRPDFVRFTKEELDEFEVDVIEASENEALFAGRHCYWCPLVGHCHVAYEHAKQLAEKDFDVVLELNDVPTLLQIVDFQDAINRMSKIAKAELLAHIQAGKRIPGYKAVRSQGHRAWTDEEKVIETLRERDLPDDVIFMPRKLRSPAQIESHVAREVLTPLYHRPDRGVRLAQESSKLPEVSFDDFEVIE